VLLLSAIASFCLSNPVKDEALKEMTATVTVLRQQQQALLAVEKASLELESVLQKQVEVDPEGAFHISQVQAQIAQTKLHLDQVKADIAKIEPGQKALAHEYLLGNRLIYGHLVVIAFIVWMLRLRMPESE
jgi:uncharacterized protein (DUF2141 family)